VDPYLFADGELMLFTNLAFSSPKYEGRARRLNLINRPRWGSRENCSPFIRHSCQTSVYGRNSWTCWVCGAVNHDAWYWNPVYVWKVIVRAVLALAEA
jgi:hypothetical protein